MTKKYFSAVWNFILKHIRNDICYVNKILEQIFRESWTNWGMKA